MLLIQTSTLFAVLIMLCSAAALCYCIYMLTAFKKPINETPTKPTLIRDQDEDYFRIFNSISVSDKMFQITNNYDAIRSFSDRYNKDPYCKSQGMRLLILNQKRALQIEPISYNDNMR